MFQSRITIKENNIVNTEDQRSGQKRRSKVDRRKFNDSDYTDPDKRSKQNRRTGEERRESQ
ncbi:MAG: hypothetical protein COA98_08130 [Candidatus Neomarinimicrobiota bacterium]|nr:MAG: hypothetical protein COA98_08130 [Candidatus Neomarinimicrobiota bacterium]